VLGMIRERLAEADAAMGFILDGFPRNIVQAEALDQMLSEVGKPLTSVVQMDVPYTELTRRIAGRRSCQNCSRVFNIYSMPVGAPLVCPSCVGNPELFQRPDDNEATVVERLKVYESQTRPLIKYYTKQGLLQSIDAQGEVDAITALLVHVLTAPVLSMPAVSVSKSKAKAKAKAKKKAKVVKKPAAKRMPAAKKKAAKKKAKQAPARKKSPVSKKRPAKRAVAKRRPVRKPASRKPARKK
jgi:adenylate kinase